MAAVDTSGMIPLDRVEVTPFLEPPERELLKAALPKIYRFMEDTDLFDRVVGAFYADGLIDKVMVFLFEGEVDGYMDEQSWVVLGDLPPWTSPPNPGEKPADALMRYTAEFRDTVSRLSRGEEPAEEDVPICHAYSIYLAQIDPEFLLSLAGRLDFIEGQVVPWLEEGD
jgi:hypothetical protein